jgi:hypothetical protein
LGVALRHAAAELAAETKLFVKTKSETQQSSKSAE